MKSTRNRRSGMVILEFAIGSGVLVAVFAGIFSYGYAFYRYNMLLSAVTTGARYASLARWDSVTQSASSTFETRVKNVVVYGDPAGGNTPLVSGLTPANVTLTPITARPGTSSVYLPTHMQVSINTFTVPAVFRSFTFQNKPRVRFPYGGLLTPVAGGN
jgi:Flp pilus assembly protein TadG